jgi:hypothetical protein
VFNKISKPTAHAEINQQSITCLRFCPDHRGTLRGIASVLVADLGLEVPEITVHQRGEKRWALLPARPRLTADGTPVRDTRDKIAYEAVLTISDESKRAAFSRAVVDAVAAFAPAAFDSEPAELAL